MPSQITCGSALPDKTENMKIAFSLAVLVYYQNLSSHCLITGSIARSASRRYLVYSEADFEVIRPAGATRCTDGGELWHGGRVPSSVPNFTPIGATTRV